MASRFFIHTPNGPQTVSVEMLDGRPEDRDRYAYLKNERSIVREQKISGAIFGDAVPDVQMFALRLLGAVELAVVFYLLFGASFVYKNWPLAAVDMWLLVLAVFAVWFELYKHCCNIPSNALFRRVSDVVVARCLGVSFFEAAAAMTLAFVDTEYENFGPVGRLMCILVFVSALGTAAFLVYRLCKE